MIKAFDKQNLSELRKDLDAAFSQIRQKHGITISIGNISYASDKATSKITMVAVGDSTANVNDLRSAALATAQADFKRSCASFGLKPEQFGATFTYGRQTYKLAGLKPRSPKRPVIGISTADGKTYVFPEIAIAVLQSSEYKNLYGVEDTQPSGICSNTNAFDENFKPIGKCNRPATTSRKGFGLHSKAQSFCENCARLIDESRAEMSYERRAS